MPDRSPAVPLEARSMYGTHLLNHLTAYGAGLTAGQIAVITLLEVDADLACSLHLKLIHCGACFRYHALIGTVFRVSHNFDLSFTICVLWLADSMLRKNNSDIS